MRLAFTLVAIAAAASPMSAQRSSAAPSRDGDFVTADGLTLHYRVQGRGPDTLIAIHGGPGVDLESIAGDFVPLTRHHVVIFYDQRGAGRSTLPADTTVLTAERQVADLEEVRRHFNVDKPTLIAHSYGPLLAASYALAHPDHVKRMVFFGPVPPYEGNFNERYVRSLTSRLDSAQSARMADAGARLADASADARQACKDYWAEGLPPRLAEPKRTLRLIKADLCASDPAGIRYGLTTTTRVVWASYGAWDLRESLKSLQVPLLVMHGTAESIPMDMVEAWVTSMPHARLIKVPRAAHFPYVERPEIVWPAVERFLATPVY